MEVDTRRLQPANISMFSIERGAERYELGSALPPPSFSPWRCNLTALSQKYNLYFVATVDSIAVFVPEFPYQKLGTKPALVITPSLANPNAKGYIDKDSPHAINHLLVGDLGNEEILLVARDSGNIDAYHTRGIKDAINKEPYRFSKEGHADFVGLRAFFSQWVHRSAWGLAIHKEARMIAVSANRDPRFNAEDPHAKITVFAFALSGAREAELVNDSDEDQESSAADSEWRTWRPDSVLWDQRIPPRNHNYKIVLDEGHHNNIPSISFSNTIEDQMGMWLFSTDIEGDMIAWNVWKKEIVNCWTTATNLPGEMPLRVGRGVHREAIIVRGAARRIDGGETDRGWIVAALDPRAFAVANDMAEFCGVTPLVTNSQQTSFGISDIAASSVPGNSQLNPQHQRPVVDFGREPTTQSSDSGGEEDADAELLLDHDTSNAVVAFEPVEAIDAEDASASIDQDIDDFSNATGSSSSLSSINPPPSADTSRFYKRLIPSAQHDEQELWEYGMGSMVGELGSDSQSDEALLEMPTFPLLHCSVSHMRLFDAPCAERPHWFCGDLLTQLVPDDLARRAPYVLERMNMFQQVPELGLVIIASQSGRCAICSTVRKTRDGPLGLRADWVLPTMKQERAGFRPPHALLGIAVGPIQGFFKEGGVANEEDGAFQDGVLDGTLTSFDTDVIMSESSQDENGLSSDERDTKRVKMSGPPLISPGRYSRREQRVWSNPEPVEAWRGNNYSRRYRLMLTYWDWTILTYEIAREAPNVGIDPTRKNFRNRSAASEGYYDLHTEAEAANGAEDHV
jgi:hypothetical protein